MNELLWIAVAIFVLAGVTWVHACVVSQRLREIRDRLPRDLQRRLPEDD